MREFSSLGLYAHVGSVRMYSPEKMANEMIEFDSERGKGMCVAVGVMTCSSCRVSMMHHGVVVGVCCVRCGRGVGEKGPAVQVREELVALVEIWR